MSLKDIKIWKKATIIMLMLVTLLGMTSSRNPHVFADDGVVDSTPVEAPTVSNTTAQEETDESRSTSFFPQDYETYIPMPLPERTEVESDISENRFVTYDVQTGEETVSEVEFSSLMQTMEVEGSQDGHGNTLPNSILNFSALSLVTNPEDFPFRRSVKMFFTQGGTGFVCSGALIDPLHVITAGHCVHEGEDGTWSDDVVIVPAYENGARPFGDARGIQLHSWEGWTEDSDWDHDIGIIDLDRPIGALTGWHGYGYHNDCDYFTGGTWQHDGYPAESPFTGQFMYTQQGDFDDCETILGIWYGNEVSFDRRSYGGQSGTGAYRNQIVRAVLSNGNSDTTWDVRITENKFGHIRDDFIANDKPTTFDLIPLDTNASPTNVVAGDSLSSMNFLVHNYSTASWSGTVNFTIYLSSNDNISISDTVLGTSSFDWSFGPLDSVRVNVTGPPNIPLTTSAGDQWLGVILDVSDDNLSNNDSDGQDAQQLNILLPPPPTANANGAYSTTEGTPRLLFGSSTGTLTTASWDLDNDGFYEESGLFATFDNVAQDGIFPISLRVTDYYGRSAYDFTSVTVENLPPVVDAGPDLNSAEGSSVSLNAAFTDAGILDLHTAVIDWGDGSSEPGTVSETSGSGTVTGAHAYAESGDYTMTVTVTDDYGDSHSDTVIVQVANLPPSVDAGPNQVVLEDETVTLSATFVDPGIVDTHSATVDWGDGSPVEAGIVIETDGSGTVSATHAYMTPGLYTVMVSVTDDEGATGSDTMEVLVGYGMLQYCVFGQRDDWVVKVEALVDIDCDLGGNGTVNISSHTNIDGDVTSYGGNVLIYEDSIVNGNVESTGIVIVNEADVCGNIIADDDVRLGPNALICGDVTASGEITLRPGVVVSGTIDAKTSVSLSEPLTNLDPFSFTTAGPDVLINTWDDETLLPGEYGNVIVNPSGDLHLTSGHYTFKRFELRRWSKLYFDLSAGPIIIDVDGDLWTDRGVTMLVESSEGDASDILFRVARNITLGERGEFLGTYIAPSFETELQKKATLNGALYGNALFIGQDVTIYGNPALALIIDIFAP